MKLRGYFTKAELYLWGLSSVAIILSFVLFDRGGLLTLIASLIGVTSLIFNAKGNPLGQALMILFSIMYAVISYSFAYYGEMITYLGMALPMAVFSLVSWLRHPYNGNKAQVEVNVISKKEHVFMWLVTLIVTVVFYFILEYFNTANIIPSTVSVTTSFVAAYLTFRRSPLYAIGYAANDIILIVLWVLASFSDISYISVVVCFVAFLFNDLYGFISWNRMKKKQADNKCKMQRAKCKMRNA